MLLTNFRWDRTRVLFPGFVPAPQCSDDESRVVGLLRTRHVPQLLGLILPERFAQCSARCASMCQLAHKSARYCGPGEVSPLLFSPLLPPATGRIRSDRMESISDSEVFLILSRAQYISVSIPASPLCSSPILVRSVTVLSS